MTSYYHGIFIPPSAPSNTGPAGAMADTTGAIVPTTQSSATYVPPTSSTDAITIGGVPITVTFNTTATQTVTDAKALILLNGQLSQLVVASGTATLVITALAPGTVGDGIPVTSTLAHGSTGWTQNSTATSFTRGGTRWYGQGGGATQYSGDILGGCGALCTGVGYGTNMTPVLARLSDGTVTSRQIGSGLDVQAPAQFAALRILASQSTAATSTFTPPTSATATCVINGVSFTATWDSVSADTTIASLMALIRANQAVNTLVSLSLVAHTMVVTALASGTLGNGVTTTSNAANGASFSATSTGGGVNGATTDDLAGVVQDVGGTYSPLIAATATYTPPTSLTDTIFINGSPITVTFNTTATQTVTDLKALIAAVAWMNNLVVLTGTTTLVITARNTGVSGNGVTVSSSAIHGASLNHASLIGGGTGGKGVRLVKSTGTVSNGGAVISGWLNEYAGGVAADLSGGTIITGYVVVGRAQ